MSMRKRFTVRKKVCRFCEDSKVIMNYKNVELLKDYISERGKIVASRVTGTCAKHQRQLTLEIKRARQMALLYYTSSHSVDVLKRIG